MSYLSLPSKPVRPNIINFYTLFSKTLSIWSVIVYNPHYLGTVLSFVSTPVATASPRSFIVDLMGFDKIF